MMKHSPELTDIVMSFDELVSACGQEPQWVIALIEENIIEDFSLFEDWMGKYEFIIELGKELFKK